MTAEAKFSINRPAFDYPTVACFVEIRGDDGVRGMFTALSRDEANDLAERINNFPALADRLLDAEKTITRLKKQLRKLRQAQRKGGAV